MVTIGRSILSTINMSTFVSHADTPTYLWLLKANDMHVLIAFRINKTVLFNSISAAN